MAYRRWLPACAALFVVTAVGSGCGRSAGGRVPATYPSAPPLATEPTEAPAPRPDPVLTLIQRSQEFFAAGRQELALGHLERARSAFNAALDILLDSSYGARQEPRLREQFDRLVDQISAIELTALSEGDAFTETRAEPAVIDELLAMTTFGSPPVPPGLKETVTSDLETTAHDVPIPLNAKVLGYVELLQGRLQQWVSDGLSRGARYLPMIQSVFRAEGLPLDLAYVPLIESAFKPNAVSRARAAGVWQFIRGTAREQGLKHDWYIDERADPEKSTAAAARYLKLLWKTFDGDWHLALASYNGGPYLVLRAMKRTRSEDFWALAAKPRTLPRETREYVPMILAAIIIARNPLQYGIQAVPHPALDYDRVRMPGPMDLRLVAEWTGSSIDAIQQLNPELRRWTTPVRYPGYELKVPKGTGAALEERMRSVDPADLASLQWYVAKRGETLSGIANKLRVKRSDLADANYLSLRSKIATGQRLIVPRAPTELLAARAGLPAPVTESRPLPESGRALATAAPGVASEPVTRLVYRVRQGDTLGSIAALFKTSVAAIRRWNRLTGSLIRVGDRLTIFASRTSAPALRR